jgi:hypothetical protein
VLARLQEKSKTTGSRKETVKEKANAKSKTKKNSGKIALRGKDTE